MKIPINVHIELGLDTQATLDTEILVTVDASDIARAVADSRGKAPMSIIDASHNYFQFMKEIPAANIAQLTPGQRGCIASFLRETADRLEPLNQLCSTAAAPAGDRP